MKILVVRNYPQDRQYSMQAFADILSNGLVEMGYDVRVVSPPVLLGKGRNTLDGLGKWLGYIDKYVIARYALKKAEMDYNPDIVHICDHSNAMYLGLFRKQTVLMCHDLLAVRVWLGEIIGQAKGRIGGLQQKWIFKNIPRADRIVCISEATQSDLQRLAPQTRGRSRVIPLALNYPYQRIPEDEARQRMNEANVKTLSGIPIGEKWLLHVGNNSWYKNRIGALQLALHCFRYPENRDLKIVMVGESPPEELIQLTKGAEDRVAFIQNVSSQLLETLYNKATCFIFPSLAEGQGWPPIEAQACGCPIAISDIEPMRSNCRHALFFDPNDLETAARKLSQLLNDSDQLQKLSQLGIENAKRFEQKTMIESFLQTYTDLLSSTS